MRSAPIRWENGVFLAPQVFQQADRYLEAQLRFLRRVSRAQSYGILEVALDPAALALGKLKLVSCQAVLPRPDGEIIDVPNIDLPPPERDFTIPNGAQSIDVYLTVPSLSAPARTQIEEQTVSDRYDVNRTRPIKVESKALSFAVTGDPLTNLTSLKIAEVERHPQSGKPVLRSEFLPTALVLSAAPGLIQRVRKTLAVGDGRLRDLLLARKQNRVQDFAYLSAIQAHVPALHHLVEDAAESTHPVVLFEALLRLASSLQPFAETQAVWPRYDHERPERSFPPLLRMVETFLGIAPPTSLTTFKLERRNQDGSVWKGKLQPLPGERVKVLLALRGNNLDQGKIISELTKVGKVSAGNRMISAIQEGTFAIPFSHETKLPQRLQSLPGIYFRVHTEDDLFNEVRRTSEIAVFIPGDLRRNGDIEVEIIYSEGET